VSTNLTWEGVSRSCFFGAAVKFLGLPWNTVAYFGFIDTNTEGSYWTFAHEGIALRVVSI
tara:strand:+ start:1341 stop:1520 length:180 start_codon:yes stop_codon:yes gene_type:complete